MSEKNSEDINAKRKNINMSTLQEMESSFVAFKAKHADEVAKIKKMTEERLSDECGILNDQITELQTWHARLTFLLADAETMYRKMRHYFMPDRTKVKFNGDEMKIIVDGLAADYRNYRDKIKGLLDAVKCSVMLGENLRKDFNQTPGSLT